MLVEICTLIFLFVYLTGTIHSSLAVPELTSVVPGQETVASSLASSPFCSLKQTFPFVLLVFYFENPKDFR